MARFAVDTKLARFAVLIYPAKLAVETTEFQTIVERYPVVPKPITVDVILDCVGSVISSVVCK